MTHESEAPVLSPVTGNLPITRLTLSPHYTRHLATDVYIAVQLLESIQHPP